jgi:hypothetical protein
VLDQDDPATLQRLSDLERLRPGSETLRALLGMLSTKLDLCSRLPFLAYQAEREGFGEAAATFREMALDERRSLEGLLSTLKAHLEVAQEPASKEQTP